MTKQIRDRRAKSKLKAEERCYDRSGIAILSKIRCLECARYASRRAQEKFEKRREVADLCHYCGKPSEVRKYNAHKIKASDWKRKQRIGFKRIGKCANCGPDKLPHPLVCERCYMNDASRGNLGSTEYGKNWSDKIRNQNFRCFYTQRELVLCINASFDHRNPVSRFGDSANTIDNLV